MDAAQLHEMTVPDPIVEPLTKPERWVGVLPGMRRSAIYEALRRGDLPSIRVSNRLFIPTSQMLQRLGLTTPDGGEVDELRA